MRYSIRLQARPWMKAALRLPGRLRFRLCPEGGWGRPRQYPVRTGRNRFNGKPRSPTVRGHREYPAWARRGWKEEPSPAARSTPGSRTGRRGGVGTPAGRIHGVGLIGRNGEGNRQRSNTGWAAFASIQGAGSILVPPTINHRSYPGRGRFRPEMITADLSKGAELFLPFRVRGASSAVFVEYP